MHDDDSGVKQVEAVLRALTTAGKSLRLYPPTSPMPRQSIDSAKSLLDEYFASGEPVLALRVTRDGFDYRGNRVGGSFAGSTDLVTELHDHGVAELAVLPGSSAEEILAFLQIVAGDPEPVRSQGGVAALLAVAGVESLRVADVMLTSADDVGPAPDQDVDEFLLHLADDPEKLAAWFSAASSGDPRAFEEGLMEFVRVSGPSGYERFLRSLSSAFMHQDADAKDALLGLALAHGPARDLTAGVFGYLDPTDISNAILGGSFGKNMLSLSTALTKMPLEQATAQVRSEVQAMLAGGGHTEKERQFLQRMIDARQRLGGETPLVDTDRTYHQVVEVTRIPEASLAQARGVVSASGSGSALTAASVRTMTVLLDQQTDADLFYQGVDSLARMVPRLVEQGEIVLAAHVLGDLVQRGGQHASAGPDLSGRLHDALAVAMGPATAAGLMRQVAEDHSRIETARQLLRYGGEPAFRAVVSAALSHKAEGIELAEQLVGRRIVDILGELAPTAQWFQLRALVGRLAREGDPRAVSVIESLMRRPDEQSRRETVAGLVDAGGTATARLLAAALRDRSPEVALVAVRGIARSGHPGSAAHLAARLSELDVDNEDFVLAREVIAALARVPEPAADEALRKLASRKALIKRGHFAEIQDLVHKAVAARAQGGLQR